MLQVKDSLSRQIVEENITKLDDVSQDEIKTFTGGCNFLLKWYNEKSTINDQFYITKINIITFYYLFI